MSGNFDWKIWAEKGVKDALKVGGIAASFALTLVSSAWLDRIKLW